MNLHDLSNKIAETAGKIDVSGEALITYMHKFLEQTISSSPDELVKLKEHIKEAVALAEKVETAGVADYSTLNK